MTIDRAAAQAFVTTHGRLLDRRRLELLSSGDAAQGVLAALDAHRNPDGGYGWGLEPDLRSPESQPAAALHAFEALADIAPATSSRAVELCDWLETVSLADGGLPFALPVSDPTGCSHWWVSADPTVSSIQITSAVVAQALRTARHDRAVAEHRWLGRAVDHCLTAVARLDHTAHAYELSFALQLADAAVDRHPEAGAVLERLVGLLPASGSMPVAGGTAHEALHPLDFSPWADRPLRGLIPATLIEADLARLAGAQQPDGGWTVDFASASPAAALEWRGYATVRALNILGT